MRVTEGIAMKAMIPMMETQAIISTKEKPARRMREF
jgi:hypothetical protein